MIAIIITFLFVGAGLFYNASKACDVNIDYKVTVDPSSNSTGSLAEIQLACYKLCVEELRTSSMMGECLDKCEGLR